MSKNDQRQRLLGKRKVGIVAGLVVVGTAAALNRARLAKAAQGITGWVAEKQFAAESGS